MRQLRVHQSLGRQWSGGKKVREFRMNFESQ